MPTALPSATGRVIYLDRIERGRPGTRSVLPQVRVLVADGQVLVRAGIRALLEAGGGISVVAEADTAEQAVAEATRVRPDVVLLDLNLPGLDCVESTRRILLHSEAEVMLLTSSATDRRILATLEAGARGLLLKDTQGEELARAVELIAHGHEHLSPTLTRRLMAQLASTIEDQRIERDVEGAKLERLARPPHPVVHELPRRDSDNGYVYPHSAARPLSLVT
jgi:DNA-binding NarL/FixJ family response regulator